VTCSSVVFGGVGINSAAGISVRTTPENPSFNLNSPEAWDAFDAGGESSSGVSVSASSALEYSPWWRGVNLIARDVGKLPAHVYQRGEDDAKERATTHAAYPLCRWKPNPYQTANVFRTQLTAHAVNQGNGYAAIERNKATFAPRYLWPLDPADVTPVLENGKLVYVVESESGKPVWKLDAMDVVHIKGLSHDGITGYETFDVARDELGLGIGARKFCEVFYKNAVRPSVVLESATNLTEPQIQKLRESWERLYTGVDNMHRTVVLPNGLKANPLSFSAQDAQIQQTREMSVRDVANWLGIPPHKLGDNSRTAYASLEQENQAYLDGCLDFWLCSWEYELRDKLLTEAEKQADSHFVEFMREALVRANLESQGNYFRVATGGRGWMTPDEVRGKFNLPPVGGDAAELLTPANMGQGGELNDPVIDGGNPTDGNEPGNQSGRAVEAAHRAIADASRRAMKRLAVHAVKAAKQPATFLDWLDGIDTEHGPACREIVAPACDVAVALGTADTADATVGTMVGEVRAELLEVSGKVKADELAGAVAQWAESRGIR
jgi:HK97 family phage portal protein